MPVKIWERQNGVLTNRVETSRADSYRGEGYRPDAEALDQEIDQMLDEAAALSAQAAVDEPGQQAFVERWAIGRALVDSGLLQSEHLDADEQRWLWLAIAHKCRLGVRADGSAEKRWRGLIPNRESDPMRIERDVFAVGLWLQEQEVEAAMMSFGASITNSREIHRRGAINSKNLRDALARWFGELTPPRRRELTQYGNFVRLAKALAARFPARGPGSAKRPVHFSDADLYEEVRKVLDPLAAEEGTALSGP